MKRKTSVHTLRVSSKGQVAIPAEVRDRLGIRKGAVLVLVTDGRKIVLASEDDVAARVLDEFQPFLEASERVLAGVWDNDEDEAWNAV